MSNTTYRPGYSLIENAWCGNGIPKKPNNTFNPPYNYNKSCPANWTSTNVPNNNIQIVMETQNLGYNSLTHNLPSSSNNYFSYLPAYNNDINGYTPRFRKCDGTFVNMKSNK